MVAGLVPAVVVAAVVLADDATPPALQPPISELGREGAYAARIALFFADDGGCQPPPEPEILVMRDRLVVKQRWTARPPWRIVRDGGEWEALAAVLGPWRADPLMPPYDGVAVHAQAGVPYRDIIRAYEVADHAGFGHPRLVPWWGSQIVSPAHPRVTISPHELVAEVRWGRPESRRFAADYDGAEALATWLAERHPVPAEPFYFRMIDVEVGAAVSWVEWERVDTALHAAMLTPRSDEHRFSR